MESWNTKKISDTKCHIHQKWVNNCYLTNGRPIWTPVNPSLVCRGDIAPQNYPLTFVAPEFADQACEVYSGAAWNILGRCSDASSGHSISFVAGKRHVAGQINPDNDKQVLYRDAIQDGIDLIYGIHDGRNPSFQKIIVFNKSVNSKWVDVEFDVTLNDSSFIGRDFCSKDLNRSLKIDSPVAWYFVNGRKIVKPIRMMVKCISGNRVTFVKRISGCLINKVVRPGGILYSDITVTLYPEAGTGTGSSVDGTVIRDSVSESFNTIISSSGNAAIATSATFSPSIQCDTTSNMFKSCYRSLLSFFGVSFPITLSASLNVYGTGAISYSESSACLCSCDSWTGTSITASDYSTVNKTLASDTILDQSAMATSGYKTLPLNDYGMVRTVTSDYRAKFALINYNDLLGTSPPWVSNRQYNAVFYSADNTGTSQDPYISIIIDVVNSKMFSMF